MIRTAAGRVFASHYQIIISNSPSLEIPEDASWNEENSRRGYTGNSNIISFSTEADLNDHWVNVYTVQDVPNLSIYERVLLLPFTCPTGELHVMSVISLEPEMTIQFNPGNYSVYIASRNLGVDQLSLGEEGKLSDLELEQREDLERYDIFLCQGLPEQEGMIVGSEK